MKKLLYVLYVILALVAIYLAFGIFRPVVNYGTEITVDKSIEEAWGVAQDKTKYDQWLEGFKSMELIEGEYFQPGSKYKIVVEPSDEQPEFEMIETIVSLEEFDHVDMHFDSEFMDFEQRIVYSEADGKTTIRSESKVKGEGMMSRSMFAIMELFGAFTKQEKKNFEALKKLIEENTTDYYPTTEVTEEEES